MRSSREMFKSHTIIAFNWYKRNNVIEGIEGKNLPSRNKRNRNEKKAFGNIRDKFDVALKFI